MDSAPATTELPLSATRTHAATESSLRQRSSHIRSAVAAALLVLAPGAAAQSCPAATGSPAGAPLSLVLSGGGARGLAHIGVLRVLDSLGVRPSLVVGTSMGALVGALYAGGLSGREIDSLARGIPFESLFRRYAPITLMTAGDFAAPVTVLSPLFVVELRGGKPQLQSPLAREPEVNALFNQILLRANLTAAGDFDRMPIRFRAVATDMRARTIVVLRDGDLAEAVRASIAIPVVFAPVERDGRLLVDGGLSANVPVSVARGEGGARVLVSDVGASATDSIESVSAASMLSYLIDELFSQPLDPLGADDLRIRPEVRDFNPLAFSDDAVGPLIDAGYRAAATALRGCAPASASVPATPAPVPAAGMIADRLRRLADEGVYETVWLRPSRDSADRLQFASIAVPAPERVASVGLSYDGQEGARAWLSAANLSPAQGRVMIGGALSVSEWRQRLLFTTSGIRRRPLPRAPSDVPDDSIQQVRLPDPRSDSPPWSMLTRNLLRPELSLTASREIVRLYDADGHEQDRPATRDLVLFAGASITPTAGERIVLGPVAHLWSTHSALLAAGDAGHAYGGMLRAVHWFAAPSTGPDLTRLPGISVEALWLDRYRRIDAHGDFRHELGALIMRPRVGGGWGRGLPLAAQFALGGPQGFPGLRTGEQRGDRSIFGALAAMQPIAGPFYLRVEAGAGYTGFVDSRQPALMMGAAKGWVHGVDLGITADTPIGPFAISFGVASRNRSVFKIGLGS